MSETMRFQRGCRRRLSQRWMGSSTTVICLKSIRSVRGLRLCRIRRLLPVYLDLHQPGCDHVFLICRAGNNFDTGLLRWSKTEPAEGGIAALLEPLSKDL